MTQRKHSQYPIWIWEITSRLAGITANRYVIEKVNKRNKTFYLKKIKL